MSTNSRAIHTTNNFLKQFPWNDISKSTKYNGDKKMLSSRHNAERGTKPPCPIKDNLRKALVVKDLTKASEGND